MKAILTRAALSLGLLAHVGVIEAQAPASSPPATATPPLNTAPVPPVDPSAQPAPTAAAATPGATTAAAPQPPAPDAPTITAEALLGFLQREATRGGGACALSTTYRVGARVLIACGASGVWIAQIESDGSLSAVTRQAFGAPVLRLFDGGGRVWAELQGGGAAPVDPNAAHGPAPSSVTGALPGQTFAPPAIPQWSAPPPPPPRPRIGKLWEVNAMVRPFLALETLGGGAVIDLSVGYRADVPLHVWAELRPFALATGDDGGMAPYTASLLAAYDQPKFELGLGFGAQRINDPTSEVDIDGNPVQPGTGFSISQFARVGDRDGLMVSLRSDVVLFHSEFRLSNVMLHGQLPLRGEEGLWMIANGGGGITGYALGEVGLRSRVKGDGGAGSIFFTFTIGGTSLWFEEVRDIDDEFGEVDSISPDYSGPLVGFGIEGRL